jgi:Cof subfamily protein (haloacid dehalogenase superfamily)
MSPSPPSNSRRFPGMLVVDFDGTLLRSDDTVADDDLAALTELGDRGVLRVIATGRSAFSYRRAMGDRRLPVDYIVFSSGAATVRMPDQEIVSRFGLTAEETARAARVLLEHDLDFMVQDPVPENHRFCWHRSTGSPDFERRLSLYDGYRRPVPEDLSELGPSTQLLAVLPPPGAGEAAEAISASLGDFSVIRATSPLDGNSLWLEIFPRGVSKSSASQELARGFGVKPADILAIGNDYNDLDVLRWAGTAFVTANAPEDLRAEFEVVAANDHGGVAEAVESWLAG